MNDELLSQIDSKNYNTINKAYNKLVPYLIENETIYYLVVQDKIGLLNEFIAITNQRLIIYIPKQFGLSNDIVTINWLNVARCGLKEGLMKAQFMVYESQTNNLYTIDSLPKNATRKLHAMCENLIQKHYELDQRRKNQNINVNIPNNNNTNANIQLLEDLKKMYDSKLISTEDYNRKKEEILKRI